MRATSKGDGIVLPAISRWFATVNTVTVINLCYSMWQPLHGPLCGGGGSGYGAAVCARILGEIS